MKNFVSLVVLSLQLQRI